MGIAGAGRGARRLTKLVVAWLALVEAHPAAAELVARLLAPAAAVVTDGSGHSENSMTRDGVVAFSGSRPAADVVAVTGRLELFSTSTSRDPLQNADNSSTPRLWAGICSAGVRQAEASRLCQAVGFAWGTPVSELDINLTETNMGSRVILPPVQAVTELMCPRLPVASSQLPVGLAGCHCHTAASNCAIVDSTWVRCFVNDARMQMQVRIAVPSTNSLRLPGNAQSSFTYIGPASSAVNRASSTRVVGRVEVRNRGGLWGTVCDDRFGRLDAMVICRQLGFAAGTPVYSRAQRPPAAAQSMAILIDDLNCDGTETNVGHCQRRAVGHNCDHSEDAAVICGRASIAPTPTIISPPPPSSPSCYGTNVSIAAGGQECAAVVANYGCTNIVAMTCPVTCRPCFANMAIDSPSTTIAAPDACRGTNFSMQASSQECRTVVSRFGCTETVTHVCPTTCEPCTQPSRSSTQQIVRALCWGSNASLLAGGPDCAIIVSRYGCTVTVSHACPVSCAPCTLPQQHSRAHSLTTWPSTTRQQHHSETTSLSDVRNQSDKALATGVVAANAENQKKQGILIGASIATAVLILILLFGVSKWRYHQRHLDVKRSQSNNSNLFWADDMLVMSKDVYVNPTYGYSTRSHSAIGDGGVGADSCLAWLPADSKV